MRILSIILLFIFFVWSAYWLLASKILKTKFEDWFQIETENQLRQYNSISITGFPNRFDTNIKNLKIINLSPIWSLSAPLIQINKLVYKKDHNILSIKNPMTISIGDTTLSTLGDVSRASIKYSKHGNFSEIIGENKQFNIKIQQGYEWHLDNTLFAIKRKINGTSTNSYLTHMAVESIRIPQFDNLRFASFNSVKNFIFNGTLTLIPKKPESFAEQNLRSLNLSELSFQWGTFNPELSGKLYLSSENTLSGELSLKLMDWQYFLKNLEENSIIEKSKIEILMGGFNMLAAQNKSNSKLQIPISIRNNIIHVGPINFGDVSNLLNII